MKLIPYLHFTACAEEALNFYAAALDGRIVMLSRYGDGPMPAPEANKNKIMHGRLVFGDNVLMVSDACDRPLASGDSISLAVNLTNDEAAARKVFAALAEGGTVTMPFNKMFWGALFGMVTDRFGVRWMINCEMTS